jgi:hypothetical protein
MKWRITVDHVEYKTDDLAVSCTYDDKLNGTLTPFRMYDDDDTLYYEGEGDFYNNNVTGFEPLDDYGMPNAGCTRIDWFENGKWNIL